MRACKGCSHFLLSVDWSCRINDRSRLLARGYTLPEVGFPDPEGFACDDWEPP